MSGIYTPDRQVEITKLTGNVYTYHLLEMEVVSLRGSTQAIAHLAITAPEKILDAKSELQQSAVFMRYRPGLRQSPEDNKPLAFSSSPLIMLERYQKPTIKNGLRYFSALIANHEFILEDKPFLPPQNASAHDFVLEIHNANFDDDNFEPLKYLGI